MRLVVRILIIPFWIGAAGAANVATLDVRIPMRDGVSLVANTFRPSPTGKFPCILYRTPYNKGDGFTPIFRFWVDRGYAVVVQDVRGRYRSEGVFRPLGDEGQDGYDTIEWIARQTWSNGNVGMVGGSYLGIVQWKAALLGNPHLKAISPAVSGFDDYIDRFYSTGGAMKLGNRLLWMSEQLKAPGFAPDFSRFVWRLPLRTADEAATGQTSQMYQKALDHPTYDSFWRGISTREQIAKIGIPVFSTGGWYDNFVQSDLEAFAMLEKARPGISHRIMVGPWPHNRSKQFDTMDYGPDATVDLLPLQAEWFDRWLKSKAVSDVNPSPVRIFVMGANRWRDEREWPPARTRYTAMYLTSQGHANGVRGDGALTAQPPRASSADHYTYDPENPAPTRGGSVCCRGTVFPWGPYDQRDIESRPDVLVYNSAPLEKDLEITGPIRAFLYVATSAADTDFTLKIVDVFPDGRAMNLTDGILRLRYRSGIDRIVASKPGEVYRIMIDAGVTSNLFRKGHRIRLEVSSSNFPRFDRNLNTAKPLAVAMRMVQAEQTIFHDRRRPSHVLLPLIP